MFAILRPIFFVFLRKRYRYYAAKFKDKRFKKTPLLILSNHTTTLDPFLVALSFKRQIYYVATDDIFSIRFLSFLIKSLVAPIPKTKSSSDLQTVRDCYKLAKQGGTIGVFPEGNRTFYGETVHIDKAIVKLVRMLNIPLVLYNISGGHGANPRWSNNVRRGRVTGKVVKVLEAKEYSDISDDVLYKLICDTLYVNDVKNNEIKFKGVERAEYLERVCYVCPDCHEISSFKSEKNMFRCEHCRAACIYQEDLTLKFIKGFKRFTSVKDWYDYQIDYLKKIEVDFQDKEKVFLSDENVKLRHNIRAKKKIVLNCGKLSLYCDRLEIISDKGTDKFMFSDIMSMTIFGKNKIQFYTKEKAYQLIGELRFCAIKYYQYFEEFKRRVKDTK